MGPIKRKRDIPSGTTQGWVCPKLHVHLLCGLWKHQVGKQEKICVIKALLTPIGSYERILMDLMTCLLEWEGKDTILVVVELLSKLTKFESIKTMPQW
jgi:hypothetical protein